MENIRLRVSKALDYFWRRHTRLPSRSSRNTRPEDSDTDARVGELVVGGRIEARYKGREKWYPGKISRVRLNGTFDIDYDDGEKELGVARDLIRVIGSTSQSKSPQKDSRSTSFREGMKVRGRYRGRDKFFPGIISRDRGDGTYDIDINEPHSINEDLAVWFGTKKKPKGSKQPKGPWVNICRKVDGKHPPCGRPEASDRGYPKCRAVGVAGKMSDSQKKSACAQKRKAEKTHSKTGTGNKPKMVSYKPKKKNESISENIKTMVRQTLLSELKK